MRSSLRIEIFPADLDATVEFWTRALGFAVERDERRTAWPYAALRRGDALVGAAQRDRKPTAPRRPPVGVEIVLEVDDLEAARERLDEAGVTPDDDVTDQPWGLRDFRVVDPDGYYVRVTTR
ncbi:VOC family protein [Cellulomonas alba]|uniref:VOC family protein n=1 Tax=Cellulomonas alba TaxID=3053467 RepID=A0ABT7SDJ8_9CELL|nr:VOC family protein [Cellulomonas alba]MDM7854206.1 VOC family protein [Cellulomonas alba]